MSRYCQLMLFLILLFAGGCSWFSSSPPPPTPLQVAQDAAEKSRAANEVLKKNSAAPQVRWNFAAQAIELRFNTTKGLNFYDGEPHSLVIAVYQLNDPNRFNSYLTSRDKLTEIMEPHRFDPSVTAFDQIFLQPGEERVIRLDRAENSRFVALVAGYYQTDPDQSTRLFEIPVKLSPGSTELLGAPAVLSVNIFAGDTMIQQFGSN